MVEVAIKLVLNLLKGINIWQIFLFVYKHQGKDALVRLLTPPRTFVEAACKATGADVDQAIQERGEAVEEIVEFVESLLDKDFEDPDPETETL